MADEINRTSPKTQSALLEVMEEHQVTVDGKTHRTGEPFIVIATENPVGSAGTQLLPESQLDRFMICVSMGYPTAEEEIEILKREQSIEKTRERIDPVVNAEELIQMQREVKEVFVHDRIFGYIVELAKATRENEWTELGLSPRGTVALTAMAKAGSWLNGTGICRSFRCTGNISVCHRASDHSEYESEGRPYKKRRTDPAGSGECSDSDNETEILRMNR